MEELTLQENECFISDLGEGKRVQVGGETLVMGRYAVMKRHEGQLQVLEVGSDLEHLMEKYHIGQENVGVVTK